MKTLFQPLKWIVYITAGLVLFLALFVCFIGFTASGAKFAAHQISSLASSADQKVEISPPLGLLTGKLRLESVVLSDRNGAYARINGIAVDWSPMALLTGTFRADLVSASTIEFDRTPLPSEQPSTSESSGFSLPISIDIKKLAFDDIKLGEQLAGRAFELTAGGNAKASSTDMAASIAINRKDVPQAGITADFTYVPNQNVLQLKANLSEPQGGILANLLALPGTPAVSLDVDGKGPLSDWSGQLLGAVDGNRILNINGQHKLADSGERRIVLTGGGQPDMLLPPLYRQLFNGETQIDFNIVLDPNGRIDIQTGNLTTGALLLAASGTVDPQGMNDLSANLIGTNGPVDFRLPMDGGQARLLIDGADISLRGNAQAAALNVAAALRSAEIPQGRVDGVKLSATSQDLNLTALTGAIDTTVSIDGSSLISPDLDRLVKAPAKLKAPLRLSPTALGFEAATLESASIGGTTSGTYTFDSKTVSANLRLFAVPQILPEALAEKFEKTIAVEGYVNAVIGGKTSLENLVLRSDLVEANGDLLLDNGTLQAKLGGRFLALEKLLANAQGAAGFAVEATGPLATPDFKASLNSARATMAGRSLEAFALSASGKADPAAPQAEIAASGTLDGQPIEAKAALVQDQNGTALPSLRVDIGPNSLTGDLRFTPTFQPNGTLAFDFPDVSLLAALAAQQAAGDLKGSAVFNSNATTTAITLKANSKSLSQGTNGISDLAADIAVTDLNALAAQGTLTAQTINAGTNTISGLKLDITQAGTATGFDLNARYDNAPLTASGSVDTGKQPLMVAIRNFSAAPRGIAVKLAQPTNIAVENGTAQINGLTIQTGNGRIEVNGSAGSNLDINAVIRSLPANLANAFADGLDASGDISGTVTAKGAAANPSVSYDLSWNNAVVSQTRAAGLAPLSIKANGSFADNLLKITTGLSGQGGLSLNGGGSLGISGNQPLSLQFKGNLPFAAVAAQTAQQGLSITGSANIDLNISGTAAAPSITGTISTDGTQLTDVRRNLTVNNLGATITFDRDRAVISRLSGRLAAGGTISASGSVGITPASNFPADLSIVLDRAAYNDGTLVTTIVSGTLTMKGALLANPVLAGTLTLDRSAITIPERLPASLTAIDIKHRNAPPAVRKQVSSMQSDESNGSSSTIGLDLNIQAPNGIFVRGRGVDAELTGNLTVRGTAADPVVSGGFTMKRGRLEVLTKRLDFTTGNITFGGGLVPVLDMAADSASGSTTITVSVSGLANDPAITFSSSPALPQDEVLAQLIFGQSMSKLSALQIARLADAASQLAGGRSTSLFNSLRSNLGVDDLDISTDEKGDAKVSAGKYINDRTYLELEQSGSSGAKAVINLDVGKGVKLRGEAGADGGGAAGIFYEKEY
ncbi:translocation/assembly module TamB domain-containing protein [Agrobacterium sp.]|uniref:translocation/assembly module TamB domain-containing protein n=1 Tax=Agrobacterium sp. TaxID=361 RepID=UPI0028B08EC5|nr:translocation/assembly module TamB domain-containing protein [Agrobacterium sp.]